MLRGHAVSKLGESARRALIEHEIREDRRLLPGGADLPVLHKSGHHGSGQPHPHVAVVISLIEVISLHVEVARVEVGVLRMQGRDTVSQHAGLPDQLEHCPFGLAREQVVPRHGRREYLVRSDLPIGRAVRVEVIEEAARIRIGKLTGERISDAPGDLTPP